MRLPVRLAVVLAGTLSATAAAAQQVSPPFVGPVRQWLFKGCASGSVPNAERTALLTGDAFCLEGTLTVGNTNSWVAALVSWTPRWAPGTTPVNWVETWNSYTPLLFVGGASPYRSEEYTGGQFSPSETSRWYVLDCRNQPDQSSPRCWTPELKSLEPYTPASLGIGQYYWVDMPPYDNRNLYYGGSHNAFVTITQFSAVPEPSTYVLLGTGLLSIGGIAANQRRKRAGA